MWRGWSATKVFIVLVNLCLAACQSSPLIAVANRVGNSITEYPIDSTGNVAPAATIAGNLTGLASPFGIVGDSAGSLHVGNIDGGSGGGGSITSYASGASGNVTPVATITGPNTGLTRPSGSVGAVALGPGLRIYAAGFANYNSVTVHRATDTGNASPLATISGSNTQLNWPGGAAIDAAGKLYVVNSQTPSVTVYAAGATGNVAPIAAITGPRTGLNAPGQVAVDARGTVFVANGGTPGSDVGSVTIYAPGANGNVAPSRTIAGPATGLYQPHGIAVDGNGRIYASNSCRAPIACIQQPHHDDTIVVFAPGASGNVAPVATISGAATGLFYPAGLTIIRSDP